MKPVTIDLPTYAACYLLMSDSEGMSRADIKAVDAALKYEFTQPGAWICVDMARDSAYFGVFGDKQCELATYTFIARR